MDFSYLLEPFEKVVCQADEAFARISREYPECVACRPQCSDCCHAVFGLFPIEAWFLKSDFDRLAEGTRQDALKRADEADQELLKLEASLKSFEDDPHMQAYAVSKARIRCPLLGDDHQCILYDYRPMTCRTYGIPTMIQGRPRVCGKAGFQKGVNYPIFNIKAIHRELYRLSKELVERIGMEDAEKAGFLISISKIIKTPFEELIRL